MCQCVCDYNYSTTKYSKGPNKATNGKPVNYPPPLDTATKETKDKDSGNHVHMH